MMEMTELNDNMSQLKALLAELQTQCLTIGNNAPLPPPILIIQ